MLGNSSRLLHQNWMMNLINNNVQTIDDNVQAFPAYRANTSVMLECSNLCCPLPICIKYSVWYSVTWGVSAVTATPQQMLQPTFFTHSANESVRLKLTLGSCIFIHWSRTLALHCRTNASIEYMEQSQSSSAGLWHLHRLWQRASKRCCHYGVLVLAAVGPLFGDCSGQRTGAHLLFFQICLQGRWG